jgi:hypothetical protein
VGFFGRFRRRRGHGHVDIDRLAAKAGQLGVDPQIVKEVLTESRQPDGHIDWNVAAAKAQARGLDVSRLRDLIR